MKAISTPLEVRIARSLLSLKVGKINIVKMASSYRCVVSVVM